MKQSFPKTMSLVVGKSGKHELHNKWVVAAFEYVMDAIAWCEQCNEYGTWIAKMAEESFKEKTRYEMALYCDPDVATRNVLLIEPLSQFRWALQGSPGQMEEWEEEFEKEFPEGDWFYYHRRELSLLLNPYDDQVCSSLYEEQIEYKVVRVVLDPKEPYYP